MVIDQDDTLIRAALASARSLEPGEDEIAHVIARVTPRSKRSAGVHLDLGWGRLAAPGLAALALLGAGLYSVPVTRAALEDAGGTVGGMFSGWLGGASTEAPGTSLGPNEPAPEYLYDHDFAKEPRVIAEAGGYKLYAYIGPSGGLGFDLGNTGVGMGFEGADELGQAPLHVLGPGAMQHADAEGHVPLFGVAARPVKSVELAYESGPPLRVDGIDGGFVLLAEPSRGPREVVALDSSGDVLGRQLIDNSPHAGVQINWGKYISPAAP
jgi:hypothetical protein